MTMPWKPTNAMREVELRTDYIERTMAEHRPIDNGTLAHLMQAVEDYKARVAELEAVVGKRVMVAAVDRTPAKESKR